MDPRLRGGDRLGLIRWFPKAAIALLLPISLAACGFEPMYGREAIKDVPADFALIQIEPIKDRVGQMLHNHLRDALNPRGIPAKPSYYLKVTLTESVQETAIQRTAFAARANLVLNANFVLHDAATRAPILSGSAFSTAGYALQHADYGTLASEKDARERAVRDLTEEIRARLGFYFKRS
jgi:LPS-assembly lipoprotein